MAAQTRRTPTVIDTLAAAVLDELDGLRPQHG